MRFCTLYNILFQLCLQLQESIQGTMKMAMGIMVLLVVGAQAGSSVTVNCTEKGNYTYLEVQGSGFTTAIMETDQAAGRCNNLSYPVIYGFDCSGGCSPGCRTTIAQFGKQPTYSCEVVAYPGPAMQTLNNLYTMQNGDGATYNWCNCVSDASAGEAFGFFFGVMAVVALGTFLCTFFCPCCRRKSDDVNPMEVTLTNQRPMI